MEESNDLLKELKRIRINCLIKREMLRVSALKKTDKKKNLTIWSGVLALVTGTLLTTVFGSFLNDQALKIFASALAFTSGVLSLISTIKYPTEESTKSFEGSNKYFGLSNKIDLIMNDPTINVESIYQAFKEIKQEYVLFDENYSVFDIYRYPKKRKWYKNNGDDAFNSLLGMKQYGYGYSVLSEEETDPYEETISGQVPSHLRKFRYLRELVLKDSSNFDKQAKQIMNRENKLK